MIQNTLTETLTDLNVHDAQIQWLASAEDLQQVASASVPDPHWRIYLKAEPVGQEVQLTLAAIAPNEKVLELRVERTNRDAIQLRVISLARDLIQARTPSADSAPHSECQPCAPTRRTRSNGQAVLVFNTALIGAYAGYSIQRAGGSNDARLTYPLLALGTGIGIGAGMVVADEWDVGYGDAWYLSAGAIWPTTSALLLTNGYHSPTEDARFMVGLGGTLGGIALATSVLSTGHVTEGSAALAHSGGAVGLLLGGLSEMTVRGRTGFIPQKGMGFGAAAGVLIAGAAGPLGFDVNASSVLMMDLGAGLGGLTAAAAASPLIALGNASRDRHRLWLISVGAGAIAGAVLGYSFARHHEEGTTSSSSEPHLPNLLPYAYYIPASNGAAASNGIPGNGLLGSGVLGGGAQGAMADFGVVGQW
ncbi:MAG TPA: hypothetical protein VL137_12435 [Polyangiaceae bacterium]|nr:hypothetical protein [Polyangiaceae bacterium]